MSLYDFTTQVKDVDLNNCQVRLISGINDKEEYMLEKALENIENHFVLLVLLKNTMSVYFCFKNYITGPRLIIK